MLTENESRADDGWGHDLDQDPRCEGCGRSLIGRFGGERVSTECPACEDDFALLNRAGKLRMDGWTIVSVKVAENDESPPAE